VSAGSDYNIFILSDGSAAVTGYIARPEDYQGHFACGCQDLVDGVNSRIIDTVFDLSGNEQPAQEFTNVFAGVESSEGSGRIHSVFIDVDGAIYAAGNNDNGQLCLGDEDSRVFPSQINLPDNEKAVSAAVGGEFTLILSDSGKVYGCGSNEFGQLGLGSNVSKTYRPDSGNGLSGVRSISVGRDFSLIRTRDDLFVMGGNNYGQLCLDSAGNELLIPTVLDAADVRSFIAGKETTYILFQDGSVTSCGLNDVGQLGDGTLDNSFGTEVTLPPLDIAYIGSGPSASTVFYITSDGGVYGNGLNDRGQLGVGDLKNRKIPFEVDLPASATVGEVSASKTHTAAW